MSLCLWGQPRAWVCTDPVRLLAYPRRVPDKPRARRRTGQHTAVIKPGHILWRGRPYPPPQWPQAPYFGPPGAQGYGPYAGQAPAEQGAGLDELMREVANGNVGWSSLTQLLSLGNKEFWKGALIGSAVVLLLTNTSIKQALFGALGKNSETSSPSGEDV